MVKLSRLIISVAALIAAASQAGIYQWVDEDGNVHFTDTPPADARATEVVVHVQAATARPAAPETRVSAGEQPRSSAPVSPARTNRRADACRAPAHGARAMLCCCRFVITVSMSPVALSACGTSKT